MIRRSLLLFAALLLYMQIMAQSPGAGVGRYFNEAYRKHPNIPKGTLEAIAYSASRMNNLQPEKSNDQTNCTGMPQRFGIFGLIENGQGYFRNNLVEVARLSNITPAQFKKDVRLQILAVARFLSQQAGARKLAAGAGVESFAPVLERLSEIPDDGSGINTYARSLYTYDIYDHLRNGFSTSTLNVAPVKVQMEKVYPAKTLRTLQAPGAQVDYENDRVLSAEDVSVLSTDYGPAKWDQAHTNNWAARTGGQKPTNVTIHTAQGSYAGTISWFNNGSAKVSAHYVIRSSDGQVTQMVREKDRAYHVLNHNNYTIGIEHEGYVAESKWYTTKMYNSSAALVRDICSSWGIDRKKCFKGAASSGTNPQPVSVRIKGHQHYSGNTHTDPGKHWNWTKYYNLINPATAAATTITFTVRSESTGFGIANATATVRGPDGETQSLQTDDNGKLTLDAEKGKYTISFASKGYNDLETFFVGGEEKIINADVTLDPVVNNLAAATADVELKAADGKVTIQGYVRDAFSNKPVASATVTVGASATITDRNGYFSLIYSKYVPSITEDAAPERVAIKITKAGYIPYTALRYLEPGAYTMKVSLNRQGAAGLQESARTLKQGEEVETISHGLFDRKEAEALQRMQAEDAADAADAMDANAPVMVQDMALAAITVPTTIRVGINCSCTSCSNVKVMSLEAYVQSGLDDEWISGWGAASLRAGAVAYRSYGAWYVQHPVKSNFDIASTTCNQAWQSDTYTRTKDAAIYTKGKVLVKSGKIFRSEYSAENNNSGCGNGYSGTRSSWPCISDALCKGKAKNGHGRGMCQWGSSRWATDGKTYSWILNHYYNPGGVSTSAVAAARTTTVADDFKKPETDKSIKANRLEVAPNPVSSSEVKVTYTVTLPSQAMLQLHDNFGRLVQQQRVALQQGVNRLSLDVSALKGGIYIVTVRAAGGSVESKKFVLIR